MDFDKLDPNFFARSAAYTSQIHRDIYPAIEPTSPALSQKGKVVIITGAAGGIGKGLATAFAKAGAHGIVLVGRNQSKLDALTTVISNEYPSVEIVGIPTNISNATAVEKLFSSVKSKFGKVDVLVNNAGVLSTQGPIQQSDPKGWWENFDINVLGTYLITRGFLALLGNEKHGSIVNVSSGAATTVLPGMSAYGISKLSVHRLSEYVAMENPNVTCVTLDPGTVNTDMVFDAFRKFALDTPELVGGTTVWLSTEAASFMNGRVMMANWAVDELIKRQAEISGGNDLKMILQGKFGIAS